VLCYCYVVDGLLCAGHDISDGGLITCLLEMAFAGNCSVEADFDTDDSGLQNDSQNIAVISSGPFMDHTAKLDLQCIIFFVKVKVNVGLYSASS